MKKVAVWGLVGLAFVLAMWMAGGSHRSEPNLGGSTQMGGDLHRSAASAGVQPVNEVASSTARVEPKVEYPAALALFRDAHTAREVLPIFVRLKAERVAGSYGLSQELRLNCLGAMTAALSARLDRQDPNRALRPNGGQGQAVVNADLMAKREAAAQEIDRRCGPLLQMSDRDLPLGDDQFGLNYQKSLAQYPNGQPFSGPAAKEIARQGLLVAQLDTVFQAPTNGHPHYFQGKSYAAASDLQALQLAAAWARGEFAGGTGASADHILSLMVCAQGYNCEGDWRTAYAQGRGASEAVQAQARELLPRIKAALEANNLDAFRPPPKR